MADQQLFFINLQGAGIQGESQKVGHPNWMEAASWNFSMTQSADHSLGTSVGAGTAAFGSFSFDRTFDKASPRLLAHCSQGTHIAQVQFDAERQGTQQADARGSNPSQVYFTLVFKDVVISGRSVSHHDSERGRESISFAFREVELTHRQVMPDGTIKPAVTKKYDAKQNRAS
jgi:type VI secretion system secreted protein Hcp